MSSVPGVVPEPDPAVPPLKSNVFASFQNANTALFMMFPYAHRGAIVPAITLQQGHPDVNANGFGDGSFFHRNSEEEVIMGWGGTDPHFKPGLMIVLGKQHGVGLKLPDASDPEHYNLSVITTRQTDVKENQPESLIFRCPHCNGKVLQCNFEGNAENLSGSGDPHAPIPGLYPMAPTVAFGFEAVNEYNATIADKPCAKCGEVIPKFPTEPWGWHIGVGHRKAVVEGYQQFQHVLAEVADKKSEKVHAA